MPTEKRTLKLQFSMSAPRSAHLSNGPEVEAAGGCDPPARLCTKPGLAIVSGPGRAAPSLRPHDREKTLIQARLPGALIAAVYVASGPTTESSVLRQQMNSDGAAHSIARHVRTRAVPNLSCMKNARARRRRNILWCRRLDAECTRCSTHWSAVILITVKLARHPRQRPALRTWYVLDRSCLAGGIVERDPACDRRGRVEEIHERRILMKSDGFGLRCLPPNAVLSQTHAGPTGEQTSDTCNVRRQCESGHRKIRLPGVGHVARNIGQTHTFPPVPFIGINAGIEFAGKQFGKRCAQCCHLIWPEAALDDEEAVAAEAIDLWFTKA